MTLEQVAPPLAGWNESAPTLTNSGGMTTVPLSQALLLDRLGSVTPAGAVTWPHTSKSPEAVFRMLSCTWTLIVAPAGMVAWKLKAVLPTVMLEHDAPGSVEEQVSGVMKVMLLAVRLPETVALTTSLGPLLVTWMVMAGLVPTGGEAGTLTVMLRSASPRMVLDRVTGPSLPISWSAPSPVWTTCAVTLNAPLASELRVMESVIVIDSVGPSSMPVRSGSPVPLAAGQAAPAHVQVAVYVPPVSEIVVSRSAVLPGTVSDSALPTTMVYTVGVMSPATSCRLGSGPVRPTYRSIFEPTDTNQVSDRSSGVAGCRM